MKALKHLTSRTFVLEQANIDTDQIIPARFLTTTQSTGLGRYAFYDWRFDKAGLERPDCALNAPETRQREILVGGANFGCGSSREHAPWALLDFGFRVVISSRIADIFHSNACNCGLLPIVLAEAEHRWLLEHPGSEVTVNVQDTWVEIVPGRRVNFELDPFARHCLINGLDTLGYLLQQIPAIEAFEKKNHGSAHRIAAR